MAIGPAGARTKPTGSTARCQRRPPARPRFGGRFQERLVEVIGRLSQGSNGRRVLGSSATPPSDAERPGSAELRRGLPLHLCGPTGAETHGRREAKLSSRVCLATVACSLGIVSPVSSIPGIGTDLALYLLGAPEPPLPQQKPNRRPGCDSRRSSRALIDLAQRAKQVGGIPRDEAATLIQWAEEYGIRYHEDAGPGYNHAYLLVYAPTANNSNRRR